MYSVFDVTYVFDVFSCGEQGTVSGSYKRIKIVLHCALYSYILNSTTETAYSCLVSYR